MGGGLASYAALRNKVPAVVMNPMRLGWGARARIGQSRLDEADRYLTEVVVQGDWVADNDLSKLYVPLAPVFNSRGPLGYARRFMVPGYDASSDFRHNAVGDLAGQMVTHHDRLQQRAPTLLRHLQQTSPRARGAMMGGRLAPAIGEAIRQGAPDLRMSSYQRRYIADLVTTLIRGRDSDNKALDGQQIAGLRQILARQLQSVRQANPGTPLPPVLQSIEADFVTAVPSAVREAFAGQDVNALKAFQAFKREYQPGGGKFAAIIDQFDSEEELPANLLQREINSELNMRFGKNGHKLSADAAENEANAAKAVMKGVEATLLAQLRLVGTDPELERLVDKAALWAREGVPASAAST
jgi:hypothetical protein